VNLKVIDGDFSVCKLGKLDEVNLKDKFVFLSVTDQEISLVCHTACVPKDCLAVEHGWRGFRIEGNLDFTLVGILSKISAVLAEHNISIFAVSTFNTDYILVKSEQMYRAVEVLKENGYQFL
jgi:hypothetical protein